MRILGDWDVAEELVQDAAVAALEHWPAEGIPDNPGAWLMTTARRRAVDRLRRQARYRDRLAQLGHEATQMDADCTGGPMAADDRLRLIFTCCHPALSREAQVALRCAPSADSRRRPWPGIPGAGGDHRAAPGSRQAQDPRCRHPYRVPELADMPPRLDQVLAVLYLIFNEGYLASAGDAPERRELARDAEWLTSLLVRLMPDEPEPMGLLALMRLHLARRRALLVRRRAHPASGPGSPPVGPARDHRGRGAGRAGAARQTGGSLPAAGGDRGGACRVAVVRRDRLGRGGGPLRPPVRIQPTPVVALNRALALAELRGPEPAMAEVEPLAERLAGYHLYHAARGELLRRLGRFDEARRADQEALRLTDNPAEQRRSGADRGRGRVTGPGAPAFQWRAGTLRRPSMKERRA